MTFEGRQSASVQPSWPLPATSPQRFASLTSLLPPPARRSSGPSISSPARSCSAGRRTYFLQSLPAESMAHTSARDRRGHHAGFLQALVRGGLRNMIELEPIGVVRTQFRNAAEVPLQTYRATGDRGRVILASSYREGLRGLEGFDYVHLIVLLDRAGSPQLTVEPLLVPGSDVQVGSSQRFTRPARIDWHSAWSGSST